MQMTLAKAMHEDEDVERTSVWMWTDGACSGNPGKAGYAAILKSEAGHKKQVTGRIENGTNNIAELSAVKLGLEQLQRPCKVTVITDSRLVIGWLRDGWRRKDAECRAILEAIDVLVRDGKHILEFEQVAGHSGDPMNEKCDALARAAIYG